MASKDLRQRVDDTVNSVTGKIRSFWESFWIINPNNPLRIYLTTPLIGFQVGSLQGTVVGYIVSCYTEYKGHGILGRALTAPFWARVSTYSFVFGAATSCSLTYVLIANLGKYVEGPQEKANMAASWAHNWEMQKFQIFTLTGALATLPWRKQFTGSFRGMIVGSSFGVAAWAAQWLWKNGTHGYIPGPMIPGKYWEQRSEEQDRQKLREARRLERQARRRRTEADTSEVKSEEKDG